MAGKKHSNCVLPHISVLAWKLILRENIISFEGKRYYLTGQVLIFNNGLCEFGASLVAQLVKNLPALWEPGFNHWVGKIPCRRERLPISIFWPGESMGSQRVGHD